MQFKFKTIDIQDPTKITEKEDRANNKEELISMYKYLGYNIEILEQQGEPTTTNVLAGAGTPPRPGSGVIVDSTANYKAPKSKYIPAAERINTQFFTDGDTEFKIENGILYKKGWIDVDMSEHRIVNKRIEKLDWISLAKPEPPAPEIIEEPTQIEPTEVEEIPEDNLDIPLE